MIMGLALVFIIFFINTEVKMQDKLQGKLYKSEAVSAAKRGKTAKKTLSTS